LCIRWRYLLNRNLLGLLDNVIPNMGATDQVAQRHPRRHNISCWQLVLLCTVCHHVHSSSGATYFYC